MGILNDNIKQSRLKNGLTLEEVANYIGVTRQTVQKYESGLIASIPSDKIERMASLFGVTPAYLMGWTDNTSQIKMHKKGIKIPVLGTVVAGIPIEAIEEILDYEEIDEKLAQTGDFFALRVKGDSMQPNILKGDVAIIRKQPIAQNGEIAVVLVNGHEATVKKFKMTEKGIMLTAYNPNYEPMFFTPDEVNSLPVEVIGKVVELRRKFEYI